MVRQSNIVDRIHPPIYYFKQMTIGAIAYDVNLSADKNLPRHGYGPNLFYHIHNLYPLKGNTREIYKV